MCEKAFGLGTVIFYDTPLFEKSVSLGSDLDHGEINFRKLVVVSIESSLTCLRAEFSEALVVISKSLDRLILLIKNKKVNRH